MLLQPRSQLLVSVRSAAEAEIALAGGAELIDVKEPERGSLGQAETATITAVIQQVAGRRPVSAAMGELRDWSRSDFLSPDLVTLSFLKWGLSGCHPAHDWRGELSLFAETKLVPNGPKVVSVAYADWQHAQSPPLWEIVEFASQRPGGVLLIDTWDKDLGKTLLDWLPRSELFKLSCHCRSHSVRLALAGSLGFAEIQQLLDLQPNWFAVRGAVCTKGRTSSIDLNLVLSLVQLLQNAPPVPTDEN